MLVMRPVGGHCPATGQLGRLGVATPRSSRGCAVLPTAPVHSMPPQLPHPAVASRESPLRSRRAESPFRWEYDGHVCGMRNPSHSSCTRVIPMKGLDAFPRGHRRAEIPPGDGHACGMRNPSHSSCSSVIPTMGMPTRGPNAGGGPIGRICTTSGPPSSRGSWRPLPPDRVSKATSSATSSAASSQQASNPTGSLAAMALKPDVVNREMAPEPHWDGLVWLPHEDLAMRTLLGPTRWDVHVKTKSTEVQEALSNWEREHGELREALNALTMADGANALER